MNKSPAFQFYPDKWQSHTRRLSDQSYRVFHELICWMWQSAEDHCSIEASTEAVACAVAMPIECVRIALADIQNPFAPLLKSEGGRWVCNGLRKEAEKQAARRQKAKESANARWNDANASPEHCQNHAQSGASRADQENPAERNANAMRTHPAKMRTHQKPDGFASFEQCFPSPSPSLSPKEEREPSAPAASRPLSQVKEVFDAWNSAGGIPKCLVMSDARRRRLESRLRDPFFAANWQTALAKVKTSPFCRGENDRGWRASFDWFIQPDTCAKILEGKYDTNNANSSPNPARPHRNDFIAGAYDATRPSASEILRRRKEREANERAAAAVLPVAGEVVQPPGEPSGDTGGR